MLAGLILGAYLVLVAAPGKGTFAVDAIAYWRVDLADPYRAAPAGGAWGDIGFFFPYAPPIALLFAPFAALPWLAFVTLWYGLLIAALTWLGRRSVLLLAAFPPVALNLSDGNIHILLAAALVLGLLWFVARREWRQLVIALGVTAAIVAVTAVALPGQWLGWLEMLRDSAGVPPPWPALPIPLWLRLPVAAAIVWWGARRDARWTVPLGATIALPALWLGGLAMLVGCWPLRSRTASPSAVKHDAAGYHAPDGLRHADSDTRARSVTV